MMERAKQKVTIELDEETVAYLAVLGRGDAIFDGKGTVEDVLLHLAHSAADGVRRPGSWERAFSDDFTEHLLPHREMPNYDVPKPAKPKPSKA